MLWLLPRISPSKEQGELLLVQPLNRSELAGVRVKSGSDVRESGVDVAGQRLHASRRREGDKSNNESILDQILTFFTHQALDFDRQLQKCILHF